MRSAPRDDNARDATPDSVRKMRGAARSTPRLRALYAARASMQKDEAPLMKERATRDAPDARDACRAASSARLFFDARRTCAHDDIE